MKSAVILAFSLLVAACSAPKGDTVAADNTKKNDRDRNAATVTPGDQGENDMDRGITQKIRQAVVQDNALSMNAKNVKIVTTGGAVTLRGPVKSADEKAEIGRLAQSNGAKSVDNQLEIASN